MLKWSAGLNAGLLLALLLLTATGAPIPASTLWIAFIVTAGLTYLSFIA